MRRLIPFLIALGAVSCGSSTPDDDFFAKRCDDIEEEDDGEYCYLRVFPMMCYRTCAWSSFYLLGDGDR